MEKLLLFFLLSIPIVRASWRSVFVVQSHGFPRFFSWEAIAWLLASNYKYWFRDPLATNQIISWILLTVSVYIAIVGFLQMRRQGRASQQREDSTLFGFEKTTELIDTGLFKYIRHPLYSSLIYLSWGIYMKNASWELLVPVLASTILLYFTSRQDEKECIRYFGDSYVQYMKRTRMFIPFLF